MRQGGSPLPFLHELIPDQKMSADLRDLQCEIEIGRKLRGFPAALTALAAFTTFPALLLGLGAALAPFAAMAVLLGGRQIRRARKGARQGEVGDGFSARTAEARPIGDRAAGDACA